MASSWDDFYTATDPLLEEEEEEVQQTATADWGQFYDTPVAEEPERAPIQEEEEIPEPIAPTPEPVAPPTEEDDYFSNFGEFGDKMRRNQIAGEENRAAYRAQRDSGETSNMISDETKNKVDDWALGLWQDTKDFFRGIGGTFSSSVAEQAAAPADIVDKLDSFVTNPMAAQFRMGYGQQLESAGGELPEVAPTKLGEFVIGARDIAAMERAVAEQHRPENPVGGFIYDAGGALAVMGPSIAAMAITKSPGAAMSLMGSPAFSQTYEEELRNGASTADAMSRGLRQLGYELGPEAMFGVVGKAIGAKSLMDIAKVAGLESMTEGVTEALSIADEIWHGKDVGGVSEVAGRILYSGALGAFLGGGMATPAVTANIAQRKVDESRSPETPATAPVPETVTEQVEQVKQELPTIESDQQSDPSPVEMPTTEETTTPIDNVEVEGLDASTPAMENVEELKQQAEEQPQSELEWPEGTPTAEETREWVRNTYIETENQVWEEEAPARAKLSDAVNRDLDAIKAETQRGASGAEAITLTRAKVLARSKIVKDEQYAPKYEDYKADQRDVDRYGEEAQKDKDQEFIRDVVDILKWKYIPSYAQADRVAQLRKERAEAAGNPRVSYFEDELDGKGLSYREGAPARPDPNRPIKLYRGRRNIGGTKRSYGGTYYTEDENIARTRYAKSSENKGTVEEIEFTPENTFDVDEVQNWSEDKKQGMLDNLIEWLDAKGIKHEDSYLRDLLAETGEAHYDGVPDFAYARPHDVEFLREQGYDNARFEQEGGDVVKTRLVFDKVEQEQAAPQEDLETAEEVVEEEAAPEPEIETTERPEYSSLAHAKIEEERLARGDTPLLSEVKQGNEETIAIAHKMLDNNPLLPQEIINGLNDGTKSGVSVEELAVLLLEKTMLDNERAGLSERINDQGLTESERQTARDEWAKTELKINNIEVAARISGTQAGRALQFRRALMKEDFSLAAMEREFRASVGGRPLTEEEAGKIAKLSAELEAAQEELSKVKTEREEALRREDIAAVLKGMRKDLEGNTKKERQWLDNLNAKAEVSKAWLASKRHGTAAAGLDPRDLFHLGRIGAAKIANGAVEFADWVAAMQAELGDMWGTYSESAKEIFAASRQESENAVVEGPNGRDYILRKALAEKEAGATMSQRTVYNLAKYHYGQGVRGETDIMAAVHADLVELFPEMTEREVRQIFANYGRSQKRTQDEVTKELADIKKLVTLTEEITRLEQEEALAKNDRKKKAKNQQIVNRQRRRDALLRKLEKTNPELMQDRYEKVNAQRLARLEQELAELKVQEQTREFPEPREPVPESAEVLKAKAERDALKAAIAEIKSAQEEQLTPEQKWNARRHKQLLRRQQELEEKRRTKDYAPKPKPIAHTLDKQNLKLMADINKLQQQFLAEKYQAQQKALPVMNRAGRWLARTPAIARGIQASLDLSAIGRQAFPALVAFPKQAGIPTIKAAFLALNKQNADGLNQQVLNDPEILQAREYGLHISDPNATDPSKLEEEFMDRLLGRIPGVSHSAKSYMVSLNIARANYYKALSNTLFDGSPSPDQGRQLASLVNNATGRGAVTKRGRSKPESLNKTEQLLNGLSTLLYAPRFLFSRFVFPFKMMRGWIPGRKENKQIRKAQRQASIKVLGGMFALKSLITFAMMGLLDDDEEISWNFNPTSTDFMRVRVKTDEGVYRLDPTLGMGAGIVLASRLLTGIKTDGKGEMHPIRKNFTIFEELTGREVDKIDSSDLVTDFFKYKASPLINFATMLGFGENVVGEEVTPAQAGIESFTPLIYKDIEDTRKMFNDPAAIGLLGTAAFFGWPGSGFVNDVDENGWPVLQRESIQERDDEGARINFQ